MGRPATSKHIKLPNCIHCGSLSVYTRRDESIVCRRCGKISDKDSVKRRKENDFN